MNDFLYMFVLIDAGVLYAILQFVAFVLIDLQFPVKMKKSGRLR